MYKLISVICSLIREKVLPDAFEGLTDTSFLGIIAGLGGLTFLIHVMSYEMCGIFYSRGDNAWTGTIGYTTFFSINTFIVIELVKWFDSIKIILMLYFVVSGILYVILNKLKELMYQFG